MLSDTAGLALRLTLAESAQRQLVHLDDLSDALLDNAQHLHDVAVRDAGGSHVLQRRIVVAPHLWRV